MKRVMTCSLVGILMLGSAAFALAQQAGSQGSHPPASAPKGTTLGHDHDGHHAQHMEMCRQMMGQAGMMGGGMGSGMIGGGMMGMMPMMMSGDAKQQAEMMAMRGEMMKAMGDIMLKYAQRARSAQ
jgi:hypothetical protein